VSESRSEQLTRREREIVHVIFALGNRASAEEIRARLSTPPSSSSVRVMLSRLEKKGYLKHQEEGLRYIYSARTSPARAQKSALRQVVRTFFGGSLAKMMTALVRDEEWTDDDLQTLHAEIERVRKEGKSK
jgi:BlaI family penicillinase repressor